MKKCKTIIAVVMAISMALSVFALVGCQPASEKTQRDPEVQAVYEAYVAQAEEAGEDVLSYDEWLADLKASIKGEKGDKGDNGTDGTNGKDGSSWRVGTTVPEATLGNEGDFYLNTETFDLYLKGAEGWSKLTNIKGTDGQNGTNGTNGENGEDGARGNTITNGEGAPTSTEGAIEGDMYIDTQSWNVYFYNGTEWENKNSIKGADGQNGENGTDGKTPTIKDGSWWIGDTNTGISPYGTQWHTGNDSTPAKELGRIGDFYLNIVTFDLWIKKAGGWEKLGCLKAQGESGSEEEIVKEFKGQTIPTGAEGLQLDVSDIDTTVLSGKYRQLYVIVETSTAAKKGILSIRSSTYSYTKSKSWDMFSPASNQFKAPISRIETGNKNTVLDKFTIINNSGEEITADIKIIPYTPPVLKEGEIDIFVSPDKYDIFQLAIDPSLQNKTVKMTLTYYPTDEMFDTATINIGDKRENGTCVGDDWIYDNMAIGSNDSCYFRAGESIGKIAKLKIEVVG